MDIVLEILQTLALAASTVKTFYELWQECTGRMT